MTSRELNERVGGFREREGEVFWLEDAAYIEDIQKIGFGAAVLADLRVHHTGGSYYTTSSREKDEYWKRHWARRARRAAVKRMLVRVPFIAPPQRALLVVRGSLLSVPSCPAPFSTSPGRGATPCSRRVRRAGPGCSSRSRRCP